MENHLIVPLAGAGLALLAILAITWRSRVRAVTRWSTALNAYAEREIARERRGNDLKRIPTFATLVAVSGKVRASASDEVRTRHDRQRRGPRVKEFAGRVSAPPVPGEPSDGGVNGLVMNKGSRRRTS
jgi:hypothetical protein